MVHQWPILIECNILWYTSLHTWDEITIHFPLYAHYEIPSHFNLMKKRHHFPAVAVCSSWSCCRSSSISESCFLITASRCWIVLFLLSMHSALSFVSFISGTSISWSSWADGRSAGDDMRWSISWAWVNKQCSLHLLCNP